MCKILLTDWQLHTTTCAAGLLSSFNTIRETVCEGSSWKIPFVVFRILGFIWLNKAANRNGETGCLSCRIKKKISGVLGAQITGRQTRGREWTPYKTFGLYSVHSVISYKTCSVISEPVWQLISLISTDSSFFGPLFYFIATKIQYGSQFHGICMS